MDCVHHMVISDPDPHDSFCRDDIAVVCSLTEKRRVDPTSIYASARSKYRAITVACRPYNDRKESDKPSWCPL